MVRRLLWSLALWLLCSSPQGSSSAESGSWTLDLGDDPESLRYRPLSHRDDVWYGSTYWTGPDWTRVGRDWHHPGERTPSVRRFSVPRDGRVTITGRAFKAHVDSGTDGVRLAIRHGPREVWSAEIDGGDGDAGGSASGNAGGDAGRRAGGVEPQLTLDVRRGDAIRFVVHKRGSITCDTTHWDPLITYSDGEAFLASKAFSTRDQGAGGWFYEMEVDEGSHLGLPEVRFFDRGLALRKATVSLDRPVELSDLEALPAVVLSDGAGRGGIAAAPAGERPWRLRCSLDADIRLRVELDEGGVKTTALKPEESLRLPACRVAAFRGPWIRGLSSLRRLSEAEGSASPGAWLGQTVGERLEAASVEELELWAMVQEAWREEDKIADAPETSEDPGAYAAATARHLERALTLLADLRRDRPREFLAAEAESLLSLATGASSPRLGPGERRALYLAVRSLKRRIALANPLLGFGELLFAKRVPTSYSHLVMQYFGWRARPGGGLFILERPGRSLECRDITGGALASGNVLEPRLSCDARRIVFSFVRVTGTGYDPSRLANDVDEGFYHVWEVNVDGTGLRQLTSGPFDDLMPTYLPDGGITFSSTRRRGYARCFGAQFSPRWHVYTLHRMEAGGDDIRALSFHDTNEWFPAVSSSGLILYSRWDYIDRDAVTHQNLWATRPDGTSPVAVWGNATSSPHCAFQAQPVPGSSKIVFTASAHHSITAGSIALLDPTVARDGQSAITRLTPEVPFPEAEGTNIREYYSSPWPLSEKYFLVAYSPRPLVWEPGGNEANALGIYLLDASGNRELIYRDPEIGCESPCPLAPRPVPPVVASALEDDGSATGEMLLTDVYRGLGQIPRGTIRELRVVQILPKTTPVANAPPVGLAGEENGRAILGTVPVDPDGSARFLVPAGKPILFQALDADGLACQTMRTITYLQPGERVSCIGCHEDRMTAPMRLPSAPAALRREPSRLEPGPLGGRPFSYVEVVQPVLDRHCVRCHGGDKAHGNASNEADGEGGDKAHGLRSRGGTKGGPVTEGRPTESGTPGEVKTEGQVTDGQRTEGQRADNQRTRGDKADGQRTEDKTLRSKIDLTGAPLDGFTRSYRALCGDRNFWGEGTNPANAAGALVPRFGARNTIQVTPPGGAYGSRGSRLLRMLRGGHHDVRLDPEELRRLAAWIDLNAIFYGVNDPQDQARQLRGERVEMPEVQ